MLQNLEGIVWSESKERRTPVHRLYTTELLKKTKIHLNAVYIPDHKMGLQNFTHLDSNRPQRYLMTCLYFVNHSGNSF